MGHSVRELGSPTVIRQGLRDIRARRRRYQLVSWLGLPMIVVVCQLLWSLFELPRWWGYIVVLPVALWIWLSNRLAQQVWATKCPRCGEPFHARQWGPFELRDVFLWSCQHCGLKLRADWHLRA
jgi:hypothetical protein